MRNAVEPGAEGKTMHQGWSGRQTSPHSSSLIKFTIRTSVMPTGSIITTSSPTTTYFRPGCCRMNSQIATSTPINPPWKAIPPFQTAIKLTGLEK